MASEAAEPQAVQGAASDHDKENKFQQAIASWRSRHFFSPSLLIVLSWILMFVQVLISALSSRPSTQPPRTS
jgi:hypothetical protein